MDLVKALVHLEQLTSTISPLATTVRPCLGIVVDNDDPLGYQRVKAMLPDGTETEWASSCMPFYGVYSDPWPIGSTVVLMFAQGDPCNPIVLGGLVNDVNRPPEGQGLKLTMDSVAIQGQQVATVGAVDSRADVLLSKGWGE